MAFDITTLGIKVDSTDIKRAQKDLFDLSVKGGVAEKSLNKIGSGVQKMGIGIAAVTATMVTLGVKSVNVFADIEKGLIGVQKTTDFTSKEMGVFTNNINNLGRQIPVATRSLIGIAEAAGQLGIEGVDNVTKFTETMGKLSLATDIVGEEGAAQVARLLNVTGDGVSTVDSFGAVLVALGNSSAATESEILSLGTEVAQATSTFSVSSTEAIALGAAMRSMGVRAELGGSVVGRAMRSIEVSIEAGGAQIENLSTLTGIASEDLKEAFGSNATDVFKRWLSGVGDMVGQGNSAASVLGEFGLKGEEILKVLPTMAINIGQVEKALKTEREELEKGTALNDEAAKAGKGLSAQFIVIKNIFTEVSSFVGERFSPTIKGVTADFRQWYDVNDDLIKTDIKRWVEDIIPPMLKMVEVAGNITQSFAGWSAVGQGRLEFLEFATMDAEDLSKWLEKDRLGIVDVDNELENLRKKRQAVAETPAIYEESIKRQTRELRVYSEQIKELERKRLGIIAAAEVIEEDYTDSWLKYKNVSDNVVEDANSRIRDESGKTKKALIDDSEETKSKILEDWKEISKKTKERLDQQKHDAVESAKGITDNWLIQHNDRDMIQSRSLKTQIDLEKQANGEKLEMQDLYSSKYKENISKLTNAVVDGKNIEVAVSEIAKDKLVGFAIDAATQGLGPIFEAIGAQIGAWVSLGTAQTSTEGSTWTQKLATGAGYLAAAGAAILGARTISNNFATGGWIGANPGGGLINQGSGVKDDVFLGFSHGGSVANMGMGGEYVMDRETTAHNLPLLEWMRGKKKKVFAQGGPIKDPLPVTEQINNSGFDTFWKSVIESKGNWKKAIVDSIFYYGGTLAGMEAGKAVGPKIFGHKEGGVIGKRNFFFGGFLDDLLDPFGITDTAQEILDPLGLTDTLMQQGLGGVWGALRDLPIVDKYIKRADRILLPFVRDAITPGAGINSGTIKDSIDGMYQGLGAELADVVTGIPGIGDLFGLRRGTDYIPQDGMYFLHEGERVTPPQYNVSNDTLVQTMRSLENIMVDVSQNILDMKRILDDFNILGLPETRTT